MRIRGIKLNRGWTVRNKCVLWITLRVEVVPCFEGDASSIMELPVYLTRNARPEVFLVNRWISCMLFRFGIRLDS